MTSVAVFIRSVALVAVLGACGGDTVTDTRLLETGPIELRLRNSGTVVLTSVSVLVDENAAPITIDSLRPGQTSAFVARPSAHENPMVTVKADGQTIVSHPVEGFSGFNPELADGRYTVGMSVVTDEGSRRLDVRVMREN